MEYSLRRNFEKTPEPSFRKRSGRKRGAATFVIQEHEASSHHFDFRLEVGDVLKSWAVPKGPSTDPRDKRLAVATEDHPMEYGDFEGVIPEGQYGAGKVIVWDAGTYENLSTDDEERSIDMQTALERGHARFALRGAKLSGGYSLIHSKMGGNPKAWLLIKSRDEHADARRNPAKTQPKSVLSDRTVEEVGGEQEVEADEKETN